MVKGRLGACDHIFEQEVNDNAAHSFSNCQHHRLLVRRGRKEQILHWLCMQVVLDAWDRAR